MAAPNTSVNTIHCFRAAVLFAILSVASSVSAQSDGTSTTASDGYWASWFERSDRSKAEQPHWLTPLATTTPRLEQEFRYDVIWQATPNGPTTGNYGSGKGLELIPFDRVEIIVGVPPYLVHHQPAVEDGFGDLRVLVKYRLLSANEEDGAYIVTAFMDVSFPSGSPGNGATNTTLTPTVAYGKGFGAAAVQGTLGVGLPTGNVSVLGRTLTWNNSVQYRTGRILWPELEANATFFEDGKNDGKTQLFLTPGLVIGRLPISPRVGLTMGIGVQIPVTTFRTSDHNLIVSVRLPF